MTGTTSPPLIVANTNATLYTVVISPSSGALYRNGALSSMVVNSKFPGPNGICLGAWGTGSEYSNGMLSEVIVYKRALSTAERIAVEAYLRNKYSLVFW